ncbi:MAG TPA: SufD family Fe-S cluster assembly protein [Candidatus Binatia bacterium]|nr:SufD family Fe-S cluster assembly protein [Candidatus Binatia bacterium]
MTEPTADPTPPTAPAESIASAGLATPSPSTAARPARRSPTELSFRLDPSYVERLAAAEPDWLAADRLAALELARTAPLEPNPLFTPYLDLRTAELEGVRPYDEVLEGPGAGTAAELEEGVSAVLEIREDRIARLGIGPDAAAAGLEIVTLGDLARADEGAARRLIETSILPADDRLAQITRAAWNEALVLRLRDGARLERPILLRWAVGAPGRAVLVRVFVELGAGAAASVVEELVPSSRVGAGAGQALLATTTEVVLGAGASLAWASIGELGPNVVAFQHRTDVLGEGADLHWALGQLGGRLVRSRIDNRLVGDRSSLEQVEIVFGTGDQLFDLTTYTRHVGRDTTGDVLAKAALKDRARSFMKGLATIERSAVGTDSFLGEFGMNLSKTARSVAIPSLEIDQPDCRRAAHSSSVGPIDEAQVFYLMSRGVPEDEARKFIVLGFLEPVVARVPLPEAQERLRALIEAKWAAGATAAAA